MSRVVFYYYSNDAKIVSRLPSGEGVNVLLADEWDDLQSLLSDPAESLDMVVLESVPPAEKVEFVRRIKKIKNIPVLFFEELTPQQKQKFVPPRPPAPQPAQKKAVGNLRTAHLPSNDPIEIARRYMDDHFQTPLSLDLIAEQAGLSPSYFCRRFKEEFRKSPVSYLRNLRLNRALYLLANTDLPLSDLARQSGFYSVSYFCREFKKVLGQTPIAYRRDLKTFRS